MLERLILDKAQLQLARETGHPRRRAAARPRGAAHRREQQHDAWPSSAARWSATACPSTPAARTLREQIILSRLREREVDDKIQVSDSEIDLFLAEAKSRPERAEYNLAHILVRVPEQASPERIEAARARAEKALAEARGGADFAQRRGELLGRARRAAGRRDRLAQRTTGCPSCSPTRSAKMKPGRGQRALRSPAGFHVAQAHRAARRRRVDGAPVRQTRACATS